MIKKQAGFTIIELLIILAVVSLLLGITIQNHTIKTDEQAFEYWFQQFELDLLYIQKKAMLTRSFRGIEIYTHQNKYEIREYPSSPAYVSRKIPEGWRIEMQNMNNPISFTHTGQIRQPGRMRVLTNDSSYYIYFPFGKARSYYVKDE